MERYSIARTYQIRENVRILRVSHLFSSVQQMMVFQLFRMFALPIAFSAVFTVTCFSAYAFLPDTKVN